MGEALTQLATCSGTFLPILHSVFKSCCDLLDLSSPRFEINKISLVENEDRFNRLLSPQVLCLYYKIQHKFFGEGSSRFCVFE